jgi:hypothetical protein
MNTDNGNNEGETKRKDLTPRAQRKLKAKPFATEAQREVRPGKSEQRSFAPLR